MNSHYPVDDARERGEPLNDVHKSFIFHQFANDIGNDLLKI